jgi:hypothetical protein
MKNFLLLEEKKTLFRSGIAVAIAYRGTAIRCVKSRVDTKWRFQFFAKYDYRLLLDVIIANIANFFA